MVNLCLKVLKLVNISVVTGKEQMKYSCCQSRCLCGQCIFGIDVLHRKLFLSSCKVMDEARTAIKTVELDAILGDTREFKEIEEEEFQIRLYICEGKRAVRLKQVPFSRSILNHDDVFILDTKDKILQFNGIDFKFCLYEILHITMVENGSRSSLVTSPSRVSQKRLISRSTQKSRVKVGHYDRKLQAKGDSGEFWVIFGGFAPISKKVASDDHIVIEKTPPKLYCIAKGQVKHVDGELSKSLFENSKCHLLDCGSEVFVWVGRVTQVDERKAAMQAAEVGHCYGQDFGQYEFGLKRNIMK
ncbi:villin-3-like [Rutidosis leptorrhynchoides]|uniref:villin-3-like n=1 Tax=Rutidosis leptorrhynchoides TaxID=125765 RepID=UPI003A9A3E53